MVPIIFYERNRLCFKPYNLTFRTTLDTSSEEFFFTLQCLSQQFYYKIVQKSMIFEVC